MAQPIELAMQDAYELDQTYVIRVTAIDPATGSLVPGVNVGEVTLLVDNLTGGDLAAGTFGPFMFVPGPGA